jgi:hypothetical protein
MLAPLPSAPYRCNFWFGLRVCDPDGERMSSKTRITTFKMLSDKGELGVVLSRLMMAVNDIGIANDALGAWMGEQTGVIRKERKPGAKMYFVRILLSHTFEALRVLNKINGESELMKAVRNCSQATQDAFAEAIKVVGTDQYKFFKQVRDGIGFHYLPSVVRDTIASQATRVPDVRLTLSVGSDNLQWYYEPGDRIIDSHVVRGVFGTPEDQSAVKEVDRIIHEMHGVTEKIASFAGYFIMEVAPKQ